jgi:hypothetical protein
MSEKEKVIKVERVTVWQIKALEKLLSPISRMILELSDVDISRGRGVIVDGERHCLWTKEGHRITVDASSHGVFASKSKEIDPEMPEPESWVAEFEEW